MKEPQRAHAQKNCDRRRHGVGHACRACARSRLQSRLRPDRPSLVAGDAYRRSGCWRLSATHQHGPGVRPASRRLVGDRREGGNTRITLTDGIARMRPLLNGLTINPTEAVELKPGQAHIMFIRPTRSLKEGERFEANPSLREGWFDQSAVHRTGYGRSTSRSERP